MEAIDDVQALEKTVLVCQNRTCLKDGSAQVLAALQTYDLPGVTVSGTGCLGQCGSGPMVLVTPEQIWYSRVHYSEVPILVQEHLAGNKPVQAMMYPKFHPKPKRFGLF
jgi:(2Fe-2S) ferredoxin